ncbi:acetoacetate decarboxylase family protein [Methanothrix sp.]|uniref:acetoacetate decarboxylase family protein n=1 Tax=Methanothrix sp. TaxID=90426 RepID=UPI0032976850
MKNGSYFIEREKLNAFMKGAAMNEEEGLYIFWETDPKVARHVLPPQLELIDPEHPQVYSYFVNIREPTFAPWYMEAGIGILGARFKEHTGLYFCNLQLSGPGAQMGLLSGREMSGLPKKMCEKIVVERNDDIAHVVVEAKGRRIFEAEIEIGSYNEPLMEAGFADLVPGASADGYCFLFKYDICSGKDDNVILQNATLLGYDSVTDYRSWEAASIKSISMEPSLDDPWSELVVVKPLGAAYSINSNWVRGTHALARFEEKESDDLFSYLFAGRYDRSTICKGHQRYGQY